MASRDEWQPGKMATYEVPQHLRGGLTRYVEAGVRTGHGLESILEDRALSTVLAACDPSTIERLRPIANFITNCTPAACHGSPTKVAAWIESGGLEGRGGV